MSDTSHRFEITSHWSGDRGVINSSGGETAFSMPSTFGGSGGATNPEELLLSAVAACYQLTFSVLAKRRNVPLKSIELKVEGDILQQLGGTLKYKTVRLFPRIELEGADDNQRAIAEDLAHKAEQYCLISNAIRGSVELSVEPEIVPA